MCGRYRNRMTFSDLRGLTNPFLVRPEPAAAPNMQPQEDIRPTHLTVGDPAGGGRR